MGALQARMGLNEGILVDTSREEEEKPHTEEKREKEERIGSVGTLRL